MFVELIVLLILAGVILYLVPMDAQIKNVVVVLIILAVVYWLWTHFGHSI